MMFRLVSGHALAVAAALYFGPAVAQSLPPVEAFGSLPAISDVILSPDGKHLAALQIYKGRRVLVIYEMGAPPGTIPAILADDAHTFLDPKWANNQRLLVTLFDNGGATPHAGRGTALVSVDLKGQNLVILSRYLTTASVLDGDVDNTNRVFVPCFSTDVSSRIDLCRLDILTGQLEDVVAGKRFVSGLDYTIAWIMDGNGHVIGRIDHDDEPIVDHVRLYQNGTWKDAFDSHADVNQGAHVIVLSNDGTKLIYFATGEVNGLNAYDLATGKTDPYHFDAKYDDIDIVTASWDRRAVGVTTIIDLPVTHYFDPLVAAAAAEFETRFPGTSIGIVSMDRAKNRFIARVSAARLPPAYYYLNTQTHSVSRIGSAYPGLKEQDLGVVQPYPYKARDGLAIAAYLTLPPGKEGKNLPTVIMPHGGPEMRDSMDFDWWAQFLASRGYAVLQPNFRGSAGYGTAFHKAGFHQWGLAMQDDISDGVVKLIADGIADPKRICIVGASYGGYAALAGATFTPQQYACAAAYAGISDLYELVDAARWKASPHSEYMGYWASRLGTDSDDSTRLKATSPARHADQVRAPILLLHGQKDWTVPISQSEDMFKKLTAAGKDVQFVRLTGEDHYLEQTETRLQLLKEIEAFLAKHIGR